MTDTLHNKSFEKALLISPSSLSHHQTHYKMTRFPLSNLSTSPPWCYESLPLEIQREMSKEVFQELESKFRRAYVRQMFLLGVLALPFFPFIVFPPLYIFVLCWADSVLFRKIVGVGVPVGMCVVFLLIGRMNTVFENICDKENKKHHRLHIWIDQERVTAVETIDGPVTRVESFLVIDFALKDNESDLDTKDSVATEEDDEESLQTEEESRL